MVQRATTSRAGHATSKATRPSGIALRYRAPPSAGLPNAELLARPLPAQQSCDGSLNQRGFTGTSLLRSAGIRVVPSEGSYRLSRTWDVANLLPFPDPRLTLAGETSGCGNTSLIALCRPSRSDHQTDAAQAR